MTWLRALLIVCLLAGLVLGGYAYIEEYNRYQALYQQSQAEIARLSKEASRLGQEVTQLQEAVLAVSGQARRLFELRQKLLAENENLRRQLARYGEGVRRMYE